MNRDNQPIQWLDSRHDDVEENEAINFVYDDSANEADDQYLKDFWATMVTPRLDQSPPPQPQTPEDTLQGFFT
jgi:hypothetical protein